MSEAQELHKNLHLFNNIRNSGKVQNQNYDEEWVLVYHKKKLKPSSSLFIIIIIIIIIIILLRFKYRIIISIKFFKWMYTA